MKHFLAITTTCILLCLATQPVLADGAGIEWDVLNDEVRELFRTGKYDRGVVVAKKALEVAEQNVSSNHPDVATSLNNLALLYESQGHYAQAEPLFKRSLAILEKALGPDHPDVKHQSTEIEIQPPLLSDKEPKHFAGLHNVVAYAEGVFSGGAPEGEEGFESLKKLGIRTVLSVDGVQPEVEKARKRGLRYVHLPITYSGIVEERKLEIARVVRDLEHPVYFHCHHGKHRSAAAAGSALVTLGYITPEEAVSRMKVSGTSPHYPGLYAVVQNALPVSHVQLQKVDASFPEVSQTSGLVKSMVEIDVVTEYLKAIEKSGWKAPPNHPDLVPAAEAGRLADLLRNLQDDERSKAKPKDFMDLMLRNAKEAQNLEEGIVQGVSPQELSKRWKVVKNSCVECHKVYRNE